MATPNKVTSGSSPDAVTPDLRIVPQVPPTINEVMLRNAVQTARQVGARHLFASADALQDLSVLGAVETDNLSLVLLTHATKPEKIRAGPLFQVLAVPNVGLSRMGQVRAVMLLAHAEGLLSAGETCVCLTGEPGGPADTLMVQTAGDEHTVLSPPTAKRERTSDKLRRLVLARTLSLCLTLAAEGREGKPVGTIFVVGDHLNTLRHSRQLILNPFRGYPEADRNVLDQRLEETFRGFAGLDGAFLVKSNGVVVTAGAFLTGFPKWDDEQLRGLGTRHNSAAAITAVTEAVAFVISESSGTVRVFRSGRLITEIDRGNHLRR